MGGPKIPTQINRLRGGIKHTHRSENKNEPELPVGIPECPPHVCPLGQKEWQRIAPILLQARLLTEGDLAVMTAYCHSFGQWLESIELCREMGPVQLGAGGVPQVSPYVRYQKDAFATWMKCATQLGLTPSSRASLKVDKSDIPKAGKVKEYMNKKQATNG